MKSPRSFRPRVLVVALACTTLGLASTLRAADHGGADATVPVLPLWSGTAPGSEGKTGDEQVRVTDAGEHVVHGIHHPSLTVFLPPPAIATGTGVVICPGGAHRELWMDHEGYNLARWFADHGIAAFILKYRLSREEGSTYRLDVESLVDAQRALRLVRARAAEWHVDAARVGIIGFSAGGELAALAGARFDAPAPAGDAIDRLSARPAFQALIYPGNAKTIAPAKNAPPAFLVCGNEDNLTPPEELARVYLRFKAAGVPAELHIFTGAGHGFGLRATNKFPAGAWADRFVDWLGERGFLRAAAPDAHRPAPAA